MADNTDQSSYHPFMWIFVSGVFGAFMFSFGTGSNDVANAFATSVGSGTLTMPQAILIAAVFEFIGAIVLGQTNVNVIAGGITDRSQFTSGFGPYLFAYGMMIVMWVGGIFQLIASRLELNVSATHSVIGGIVGFGVAHKGSQGVFWFTNDPTKFPPYGGLVPIIVAWFFGPIFTMIAACLMFLFLRTFILRAENAAKRAYIVLPFAVFVTIWINTFFVCTKGAKASLDKENWNAGTAAWVAAVVAGFFSLASLCLIPFIAKRVEERLQAANAADEEAAKGESSDALLAEEGPKSIMQKVSDVLGFTEVKLSKERLEELQKENAMDEFDPSKAEQFGREAELVFNYLQVVTAIAVIFAHGANEVGYATGPLTTMWDVVNSTPNASKPATLSKGVVPPYWIIFICAFGLVAGLVVYGARLTWGVAQKFIKLSASRGFCAELSTAIVITVAAQYGLPTSSSQCITGGIVGVGLAEGLSGVNWKYFFQTFFAWVFTMFIMGISCGLIYAQGAFAPLEVNY